MLFNKAHIFLILCLAFASKISCITTYEAVRTFETSRSQGEQRMKLLAGDKAFIESVVQNPEAFNAITQLYVKSLIQQDKILINNGVHDFIEQMFTAYMRLHHYSPKARDVAKVIDDIQKANFGDLSLYVPYSVPPHLTTAEGLSLMKFVDQELRSVNEQLRPVWPLLAHENALNHIKHYIAFALNAYENARRGNSPAVEMGAPMQGMGVPMYGGGAAVHKMGVPVQGMGAPIHKMGAPVPGMDSSCGPLIKSQIAEFVNALPDPHFAPEYRVEIFKKIVSAAISEGPCGVNELKKQEGFLQELVQSGYISLVEAILVYLIELKASGIDLTSQLCDYLIERILRYSRIYMAPPKNNQDNISSVVRTIEDRDLSKFVRYVPFLVSPNSLSGGKIGTRRRLLEILNYHLQEATRKSSILDISRLKSMQSYLTLALKAYDMPA